MWLHFFEINMTILDTIVAQKQIEIAESMQSVSVAMLKESEFYARQCNSFVAALTASGSSGIIAEFKRKSPSKGWISEQASVAEVSQGYTQMGAAGISVLTDHEFFGGSKEDLLSARAHNPTTPLLRKDFMVDPYQVFEAKAWGADMILLIAACLTQEQIAMLSQHAHQLGMEVLLEVHNEEELLNSPLDYVDIIGVNNRNLKNFAESNINTSLRLTHLIPANKVKIAESCIPDTATIDELRTAGYQGFLIGESLMKTDNPAAALQSFVG